MISLAITKLLLLTTSCLVLFQLCCGEYNHTVYINPSTGNDTESCITSNSPSVPCKSLNWAFLPEHRHNSTQYVLSKGKHLLNESVAIFEKLESIAFTGTADMSVTVVECTRSYIGFAFVDVTAIEFSNLTFNSCSTLRNSTSRIFFKEKFALHKFLVGLYFYHSRDVVMSHVTVSNSPDATGVVMYDTDGTVMITNSIFTNNTVPVEDGQSSYPGGGGFYVEFSYCIPGDETCNNGSDRIKSHESRNKGAQYLFSGCIFSDNRADDSSNGSFIIPHRSDNEAFGRGGGLSILIKGNATDNNITISDCSFDSNHAVWGGGLFVELHDDTANNTVKVFGSSFTSNKCYFSTSSGTGSGGMRIGYFVFNDVPNTAANAIVVDNCVFLYNSALNGGGLSIVPVSQSTHPNQVTTISITNSYFAGNVARLGAAISFDRFSLIQKGILPHIIIENCEFFDNSVEYTLNITGYVNEPYQVGKGAVFVHQVPVSFKGEISFRNNSGTALAVVGEALDFTLCNAVFDSNEGNYGGAMFLGSAYIMIDDQTNMTFFKNKATTEGGAICNKHIEDEVLKSYTIYMNCFVRHENPNLSPEDWKSYFQFFDNYDREGDRKSSIHTTSILPCAWGGEKGMGSSRNDIFCWDRWVYWKHPFSEKGNCTHEIKSDVGNITFLDDYYVEAFPGQPFKLPIKVQDDLQIDVSKYTVFLGSTDTPDSAVGDLNQYEDSAYIWGESVAVRGAENDTITLRLNSLGDRTWHVEVVVNLLACPPGFKSSDPTGNNASTTTCVCAGTFQQAVTCDQNSLMAYLKNDNWMGPPLNNETNYVVVICPAGYCYTNSSSDTLLLPNNTKELDRHVCGEQNRTGILCGECIDGFGPAINSLTYECVNCSEQDIGANIAKYALSVYVPLAVLFTVLILFDIRLTTGPANAFILYCQVVASTFDLNADGQVPLNLVTTSSDKLLDVYRFPYGIFNLEFIENFLPPLCLGTNLNTLTLLLMKYVVALSPILMIILVVLCAKLTSCITDRCCSAGGMFHRLRVRITAKFRGVRNRDGETQTREISEAILPAFAAFLLLSYTKLGIISTFLVDTQPFLKEDGSPILPPRVYYAGQYSHDDIEYRLHYFAPAVVVFATFVAIPPLLLLDYPLWVFEWCLNKIPRLWKLYPVDKVHVFLDTFQGCYKNKMRFFAGLYFVFRLSINAAYIFTNTWLEQFAVQQVACVIMIMLLALCQPYERQMLNYVDILIFANLAVLNSLSFYLYSFSQINPQIRLPPSAFAVQYILVFLPLFYMISYIIWSLTQPWHRQIKHYARLSIRCCLRKTNLNRYRRLENFTANIVRSTSEYGSESERDFDSNADIEDIFERAEAQNTYKNPHQQVSLETPKSMSNITTPSSTDRSHLSVNSSTKGPTRGGTDRSLVSINSSVKGYGSGGYTETLSSTASSNPQTH